MKRSILMVAALALVAAVASARQASDEKKAETQKGHAVLHSAVAKVTATVEDIDYATREVTLKGPDGSMTFTAGDEVEHLDKVQKGDTVVLKYYQGLLAEARPPTAEEKANPKQAMVGGGKTMASGKPAAGVGREVRVVTTVEAIDKPHHTITFKGPAGRTETIEAQDPANLDKVKVGDTVVFTYTEALAISIVPAPKAKM